MANSYQYQIPATPGVISPSPTLSDVGSERGGYFTRSKARAGSVEPISEAQGPSAEEEDPELARARSRSRGPHLDRKLTGGRMGINGGIASRRIEETAPIPTRRKPAPVATVNTLNKMPNGIPDAKTNGFLSPASAYGQGKGSAYWRNLSRSPSPLGLIPIHREWRAFIHKHEIPRKALHVSIGFFTLWLYWRGNQISQVHPVLLGALVPILSIDLIRFRWPAFNRLYIRLLGGFMRESEAHDRFNGVISYLGGLWATMRWCPKDVAVMSVLLLSWCDTAASTFGRAFGRYTPRVRRGKSLAGSLAAFSFGVGIAAGFWGVIAPATGHVYDTGVHSFAFQGTLTLPAPAREALGWTIKDATIDGGLALGVLSVVSGLIVSASEAVDIWNLDDNLTIPVLCGIGLGAFLWAFGG